ncbi:MAG: cytochrome P450 [Opitutales bacterium]
MSQFCPHDPFKEARKKGPVLPADLDGDRIPMILRHADVKEAAKDFQTFSSDAPFRVPIPSEEKVRKVRQLPIETDPPEHTDYRAIVEPFFKRPKEREYQARLDALVADLLDKALAKGTVEVVETLLVPLQSRALTYLLNVPESEADEWIGWGTHVFKVGAGEEKGAALDRYIHRMLDKGETEPGDDFFSALTQATFRGRKLTRDEAAGFANLTFAGGRDTVINTLGTVFGYLGSNDKALPYLREDPKRLVPACEEFVRIATPLTHIGRVCPVETDVHGETVSPGERVALCWASANFDEEVFDDPEDVQLDRKPNPHLAFGFGTHMCLGALHARQIIRSVLAQLAEKVERIEILEAQEHIETEKDYERTIAYDALTVRLHPR